jgi:hypothetical protein
MEATNTLAYYDMEKVTAIKGFKVRPQIAGFNSNCKKYYSTVPWFQYNKLFYLFIISVIGK